MHLQDVVDNLAQRQQQQQQQQMAHFHYALRQNSRQECENKRCKCVAKTGDDLNCAFFIRRRFGTRNVKLYS